MRHKMLKTSSLIKIYGATCFVLEKITSNGSTYPQHSDEAFAVILLMSFVFAFILHVMKNIMRIIDMLNKISRYFKCYAFGIYHKDID
jgi:hypothetical protein